MKCRLDPLDVCHNIAKCEKLAFNVCGYAAELNKCRAEKCIYPINCTRRQECLSQQKENKEMEQDKPRMADKGDYGSVYSVEQHGDLGRTRHGNPLYYQLLDKMAETHDKKSHDYASNDNPSGNYHFAGKLSKLFDDPCDAGFIGRLGEKYYRLANLENNKKGTVAVKDESVEDTETDIAVITLLWITDRRQRRANKKAERNIGD